MNLREAIRDQLGVREVRGSSEWPAFCFSPEHDNKNTPAASVNVEKGLWHCYSCGKGGRVTDLLDGVISDPSADELIASVERSLLESNGGHPTGDAAHFTESWLRLYRLSQPHYYWKQRGFSNEAVQHFDLGYDYESNCVTYPVRDVDGSVLGVVRRRVDAGIPKYRYPKGLDVHDLLFRCHEARFGEVVVLVEGALDAVALFDAGIFALGIYGSHLSEPQQHLVIRLNPVEVILAFDNDQAGRDATRAVCEDTDIGLISRIKTVDWSNLGIKDVADLSVEQRQNLISGAVDIA